MAEAQDILTLLETRRNVLFAGPPGTGKSRLLSEVAHLFEHLGHLKFALLRPKGRRSDTGQSLFPVCRATLANPSTEKYSGAYYISQANIGTS